MTVKELIQQLQNYNPDLSVTVWDDDEDDFVDVTCAVQEFGTSEVTILTDGTIDDWKIAPEEWE